ncbi:hypothetical protein YC2023_067283 [Brassica napus]
MLSQCCRCEKSTPNVEFPKKSEESQPKFVKPVDTGKLQDSSLLEGRRLSSPTVQTVKESSKVWLSASRLVRLSYCCHKGFRREGEAAAVPPTRVGGRTRRIGSANSQLHQRFTVDTEGTRERARYHWKDLDPSFSDHLSDRQFDVRIAIPSYLLRVMLVFVRGVGAVYVCDQSGDEANLINQMVSDRSKTGGYGYRTSRATFLLEGLKIMSRDYVSGRGSRDVWTSDAALVGGGSETSGLATQLVWGVGAETFAFDAALEGGGTETYCTSDAAPAGTSLKQPQIATMKEKPSHHPEREVRAQQTRFGRTEERSIKYERNQGTGEISLERSRSQLFRSSIRSSIRRTGRKLLTFLLGEE